MGKQETQKYIPVEYNREKNTYIEEYFSAPDVEITINGGAINYISAIQYSINEQLKPIYGYQSRTFDDMAVGTRLVTGVIRVPVKNNVKNDLSDKRNQVSTLITEQEVESNKPSWINDNSIIADVYERKIIEDVIKKAQFIVDTYVYIDPNLNTRIKLYDKSTEVDIIDELDDCYIVKGNNLAGYVDKRCIRFI